MSHSSGIPVSSELKDSFGTSITSKDKRLFKVQIQNEQLVEVTSKPFNSNWESDLGVVTELLDKDQACYIIFRNDSETAQFILFCYVPDKAKVKEKMLFASTRSNLKQQLGLNYFVDEVFGTVPGDFTLNGYKHHVESKKSEAPLTEHEQMRQQERSSGDVYIGGSSATYVHGVAFPVESDAVNALKQLVGGSINYVQIKIDCDAEKIKLDHSSSIDLDSIGPEIRTDEPRFHFFAYAHEFEGSNVTSNVYIYSCPDGSKGTKSAPVRMRMLYSSSKANVADILSQAGGKVDGKIEVNTADDINDEVLLNILHPQKEEKKAAFTKPSRPGKGGRKLIK